MKRRSMSEIHKEMQKINKRKPTPKEIDSMIKVLAKEKIGVLQMVNDDNFLGQASSLETRAILHCSFGQHFRIGQLVKLDNDLILPELGEYGRILAVGQQIIGNEWIDKTYLVKTDLNEEIWVLGFEIKKF